MNTPEENLDELQDDEESQGEVQPEKILIDVDGEDQWVDAYSITAVGKLINRTYQGVMKMLRTQADKGNPITLYKPPIGRGMYILEEDFKQLRKATPVEPPYRK